jgi:hypothetical protein
MPDNRKVIMAETLTKEQVWDTRTLSSRKAADALGVGKTTVNKYRRLYEITPTDNGITEGYSFEQKLDGSITATTRPSEAPQTLEEAYELLRTKQVDIDGYNVSYGYIEKELASGKVTHQYTIRAVPKKREPNAVPQLDAEELLSAIDRYDFTPVIQTQDHTGTFVLTPSDMQIGKTSFYGGTEGTIERVVESFNHAVEFVKEYKPEEILIAELGDPLENFYSTSSQRETNDLDITGQIRVARRLMLQGVKMLAPYAPKVTYASVPSNHGSVRVNFKAPAGDNHNDWGLEIASQIEDAVRENSTLDHVGFVRPEHLYESLNVSVAGNSKIGMVHGHQSKGADKVGEWWKGQDHGRQPTWDADILLAGHWHSFRVYQSGDGRWVMVSPAQDPGSDWFTNITGEWSQTGMLSFTVRNGQWTNLAIM